MPYEEQLLKKKDEIRQILKKFGSSIEKTNCDLKEWLQKQKLVVNCDFIMILTYVPIMLLDKKMIKFAVNLKIFYHL